MGFTKVTTQMTNLNRSGGIYENEFLVDTGATDCIVPEDKLVSIGVEPEGKEVYELADGRTVEYSYGFARVEFLGFSTIAKVVFAPKNIEPLLGVVILEDLGFWIDPISRSLKKMPSKYMK